jgi:RNA polymerase sigma factor (sigma-70 family)
MSVKRAVLTEGDPFDELFRQRYGELYGLAYRVLGDRLSAEEVAQDAFIRLADSPLLERPTTETLAWLRRVCLNLAFNRARGERRGQARLERVGQLELGGGAGTADGPDRDVLRAEQQADVRRALAALPERQRECLLLRHSGYSYAEIAETLELAIGSVGVLLARAERAFRENYREQEHDLS